MHQSTPLYQTSCQCLCLPPHTNYNNEHPTIACTMINFYSEHLTNAYAYHHIPNSTTNTPPSLAPIDAAILNTSPILMLNTTYQIQQQTPHICLHQSTLLHRTLCQHLCLPPHTEYNNEHPTIACTNRHFNRTLRQCLCLPPHIKYNHKHPTIACSNINCNIEHLTKSYAYIHIMNSTTNTS